LLQIVHEYGEIPARNPGSFDHDHFIAISSSLRESGLFTAEKNGSNVVFDNVSGY
jgi:hypothetical protein